MISLDNLAMKICSKCRTEQPLTEFHKSSSHKDGLNAQCRTCFNATRRKNLNRDVDRARAREWYHKNKQKVREKQMFSKYGLTVEQYNSKLNQQSNQCKICEKIMDGLREPAIDHCHNTGNVRDLLCANCNAALGLLQDDPKIMLKAAEYVTYHRSLKADKVS